MLNIHLLIIDPQKNYSDYDVRVVKDITYTGINMAVLDKGVVVLLNETADLELFSVGGSSKIKIVSDRNLTADLSLYADSGRILFTQNNELCSMRMR